MNTPGGAGFFGKLPGMGDFVQRRLPGAFVSAWDSGFEAAVAAARREFGEAWHAVWQAGPAWRFALMPGVCGTPAWVGVMGPSMDRVGRGFPMVLACPLTDAEVFRRIVQSGAGWFDALEQVYRGAGGTPTAEAFDVAVAALPAPNDWLDATAATQPLAVDWAQAQAWRVAWNAAGEDRQLAAWLAACMSVDNGCLWWTRGGVRVPPAALLTRGLPQPETYSTFLDASRAQAHWRTYGVFEAAPTLAPPAPVPPPAAIIPGDLDDVLSDLLPPIAALGQDTSDLTLPGMIAPLPAPAPLPVHDESPQAMPAPAPSAPASAPAPVAYWQAGGAALLAANNGAADARKQAAAQVAAILDSPERLSDLGQVKARLLALHAPLHDRGEDLIDPVTEDGAVIVVRMAAGQAVLLRVGAACAWHWRRGQLRPLFEDAIPAAPSDLDDTIRRDDLVGVLSGATSRLPAPGLGAADMPRCDEASCLVDAGDRLVLLATDTLVGVSMESLAAALAGVTGEEACARIAAAAGLGTDRRQWPLAVIEVGTT